MANRLARETSPYLRQHQDNPVDWYPWCEEAFETAKRLNRPIFLSVGYSACHWCHVMERESFENAEIASLMNSLFVNVKVDREERPDVDSIYMAAVQSMSGHGGWPMSVFLTPEGEPFYGGTYFPNDERGGLPSFPRVLASVHEAYVNRRGEVAVNVSQVVESIKSQTAVRSSIEPITDALLWDAYRSLRQGFDVERGGTGLQPKFPQPMLYEFLLAHGKLAGNDEATEFTNFTLSKMADGGINDQVGGGFHRYSVDSVWLVPHFEKMLYDNAQLASLYLNAWSATKADGLKDATVRTLRYLRREMWDARHSAFWSATDADSDGEEGLFFVWNESDFMEALDERVGPIARSYWGVSRDGNFEGRNILHAARKRNAVAREFGIELEELNAILDHARARLYQRRLDRSAPATDHKVITSWNGLAIRAFATAGAMLDMPEWLGTARATAEFMTGTMVREDGRLMRTFMHSPNPKEIRRGTFEEALPSDSDGVLSPILGFLEDYGYLAEGLLALYEADFDMKWLLEAHRLCREAVRLFWDEDANGFFDTGRDHERLVVRPRDLFDNAQPSGQSSITYALLRCAQFTGDQELERYAVRSLKSAMSLMQHAPSAVTWWLRAALFYVYPVKQVVIVGQRNDPRTGSLLDEVRSEFRPDCILALCDPADAGSSNVGIPLFESRSMVDGKPTAFVCSNYVCDLPVTEPDELRQLLS